MKNILRWIITILKNRTKNKDDTMSSKTTGWIQSPTEDYDKTSTIKRVGKNIVIMNSKGKAVPISYEQVESLGNSLIEKYGTAKIKTVGLSKAQVGRVAGDLKNSTSSGVYVRKIRPQEIKAIHPMEFEITLIGDNINEEKK